SDAGADAAELPDGRGRFLGFLGFATPASPGTITTGGPSDATVVTRCSHGGRSTRYIAPAPTREPMTSPIEPRTASLYHASGDPAVEPVIAAAIVMAAMATYLMVPLLVPRELAMLAAQAALVVVPIAAVIVSHPVRPLAALGLRGARPRFFVAAVAIGCTAWYV